MSNPLKSLANWIRLRIDVWRVKRAIRKATRGFIGSCLRHDLESCVTALKSLGFSVEVDEASGIVRGTIVVPGLVHSVPVTIFLDNP